MSGVTQDQVVTADGSVNGGRRQFSHKLLTRRLPLRVLLQTHKRRCAQRVRVSRTSPSPLALRSAALPCSFDSGRPHQGEARSE